MATLSAAIVKHQVAAMSEVEEALARQVLYGGDLVTNLLEAASVSEEKLTQVLGACQGMASAPSGELPRASAETLRLVPADLAQRHSIYPLEERSGELVLASSEPLPSEVENDLAFALGVNITQLAAPLVRVRQAIARDYGVPLERRFERLLAKLEGQLPPPSFVGDERRIASASLTLPRPESLPPEAYPPNADLSAAPADRASPGHNPNLGPLPPESEWDSLAPTGRIDHRRSSSIPVRPSRPGSMRPSAPPGVVKGSQPPPSHHRRRRGPYTFALAKEDLKNATSRDEVMRAFFDFMAQYFEYTALFTVQGDLAEGWRARGPGVDGDSIARIGVPLDVPSSLAEARNRGTWQLLRLGAEGVDGGLGRDLGRSGGRTILLLPVTVRDRCVLLLYGDHGEEDVELDAIGDVIAFAPLASSALERVIVQRKLAARRAVALRDALESMPEPLVNKQRQGKRETLPPAAQRVQALAQALTTSRPSNPDGLTPAAVPVVRASWTAPRSPSIPGTPVVAPSDRAPGPAEPTPSPQIVVRAAELDEGWDEGEDDSGAPLAPASRSVHHAAVAPRRRHSASELRLPTVIVDTDSDAQLLIEKLCAGDAGAAQELIQLGEPAIVALVTRFPGPITVEPRQVNTAQPSRCGPILDVLARIGRPVEPYLLVRSADAVASVRAWATRLLGEIRGNDSARAIVKRFTDEDQDVREAALAAARMIQRDPESRATLRETLLKSASNDDLSTTTRLAMVAALAGVRDAEAVPPLIPLLNGSNVEVVQAVNDALSVLARQQFGTDVVRWKHWWESHGQQHRIEWLIDALTHDDQDVRAAAGEELKAITKEYFGYYEDLPRKERAKAQQRYRDWWESRGKAIFL